MRGSGLAVRNNFVGWEPVSGQTSNFDVLFDKLVSWFEANPEESFELPAANVHDTCDAPES